MAKQKQPKTILRLKVRGEHIKPGRVPIPELVAICQAAQDAVNRQAEVLRGKPGLRPGPIAALVKAECTLELFAIGRGSAALSFAGPEPPATDPGLGLDLERLGQRAVYEVASSLRAAKRGRPTSMDVGVRRSIQEMGASLNGRIQSIEWIAPAIRGQRPRVAVRLDEHLRARIAAGTSDATTHLVSIDGRLEMADFRLGDLKCIIHAPAGRITCSFPTEREDDVYNALRHVARVTGIATVNPKTKRIEHIAISSVTVLDPYLRADSEGFFSTPTLEQLTRAQGVDPAFDLRSLKGAWPEDEDVEAFLAAIEKGSH